MLKPIDIKLSSKAVQSKRVSVTNLKSHVQHLSIDLIINAIASNFSAGIHHLEEEELELLIDKEIIYAESLKDNEFSCLGTPKQVI